MIEEAPVKVESIPPGSNFFRCGVLDVIRAMKLIALPLERIDCQ